MGSTASQVRKPFLSLEWFSIPLLLLIWQLLALWVGHRLFPTPVAVFVELIELAGKKRLFVDMGKTLSRAAIAFVVAMFFGIFIGGLLGRFRRLDRLFANWVLIGLNLPAIGCARWIMDLLNWRRFTACRSGDASGTLSCRNLCPMC